MSIAKFTTGSVFALALNCSTFAFTADAQQPVPPVPPSSTAPAQPDQTPTPNTETQNQNNETQATETATEDTSSECSASTVNGSYGLQINGFRSQGRKLVPYVAVRTANFDGQGKTTGKGMANVNGRVMTYSVEGTYSVDKDCSITIDAQQSFGENGKSEPYSQFGVLVNGGDEIIVMQTHGPKSQVGRYEKY